MVISNYLAENGDYIIGRFGKIHVHGLVLKEPDGEEQRKMNDKKGDRPQPVEIHFSADDYTKPYIPVYEVNDEYLREHGDVCVAAFTRDSLCAAEYLTLVTARGYLIKYLTEDILAQKECFYGCYLDDDYVLTAYLSNGTEDIAVVTERGNVYIFSDEMIPEIKDANTEFGFQINVTDRRTIFDHIVIATPIQNGDELLVVTGRGYVRGIDLSKAYRVKTQYGFVQSLWSEHRAKQIPVSNKWGPLIDGGVFHEGDIMTIYDADDAYVISVCMDVADGEITIVPINEYEPIPDVPKKTRVGAIQRDEWGSEYFNDENTNEALN